MQRHTLSHQRNVWRVNNPMHVWMIINTPHFSPYEPLPLSYVTCWETPACHSDWDRPAIATPALTRPSIPLHF